MKIIDCFWEIKNIGKKTIEISIEDNDLFNRDAIEQLVCDYEYVVIKVPMNMPLFNIGLTEMGYICIENQFNVGIEYDNFDFSKIAILDKNTSFEIVSNSDGLQSIVSQIQPGMFSTDRISIDPCFGEEIGCQRYINWLTTEFENSKSLLIKVLYKKEHIGFMLVKIEQDTINLLLNGLYKQYQRKGLGILTPASPMMFSRNNNILIAKETTSISSNNTPVVKLYNRLNFQLFKQTYVFVKHNIHDTI